MLSAFLADVLIIGSLAFWVWCGLWSLIFAVMVQREHTILTGIGLGVMAAAYFVFGHHDPSVLWDTKTLGIVIGYVVAGVPWSVFRWYRHHRDLRKEYDSAKEDFLVARGVKDSTRIPDELLAEWQRSSYRMDPRRSSVKGSKAQITGWMIFWPFSMTGWVLNDPITRLFNAIFERLRGVYTGIMNRVWGDVADDFREAP